ncbi:helix-turn-helix transcriptional regulator [Actinokineospora sp. UTMC 2448]|uniref:helix-turn-helix domain-containing protein n=1 Tax=Actinokineospora sp. UTMC 2448 TaxID=2268449 RepID=UPI0021643768|nr:helix-turn-helix transcriptional regulator [Actinokineospora sp. UTMC 2448]UVS77444.1 Helix-turn-helix domain protein [Actinokineospora sp. UTMC 2448]
MPKSPKTFALGSALRAARQNNDITLRDFAGQMGVDPAMLSRWETGYRTPRPDQVARILATLGVVGEQYQDIMTLVQASPADQWIATTLPERRQQLAAFVEYEQNAATLLELLPTMIPGLLQTTEYARAMMVRAGLSADEVEARVALRNRRKEVILRPIPAHYTALIGQAALYQRIGGAKVLHNQLRYLLTLGRRANIELRILPFDADWYPGLDGSFHVISGVNLIKSVFIETGRSMVWLHRPEDVNAYRQAAEASLRAALSMDDSLRLVAALVQRTEARGDRLAQVDP